MSRSHRAARSLGSFGAERAGSRSGADEGGPRRRTEKRGDERARVFARVSHGIRQGQAAASSEEPATRLMQWVAGVGRHSRSASETLRAFRWSRPGSHPTSRRMATRRALRLFTWVHRSDTGVVLLGRAVRRPRFECPRALARPVRPARSLRSAKERSLAGSRSGSRRVRPAQADGRAER